MRSSIKRIKRAAFTLVELLTVMAIIALLIGILTPSLSSARDRGRKTAVLAQINAMSVGLEAFAGENGNRHPPSNAWQYAKDLSAPVPEAQDWEVADSTTEVLQGAHLLVDYLVGRDLQGYDPRPTLTGAPAGYTYDRWLPDNGRQQPYLAKDGIDVTRNEDVPPEDGFGVVPSTLGDPQPRIQGSGAAGNELVCGVFRDKFGWPILYYRASPTANVNTPIMQTQDAAPYVYHGDGVYDGHDNEVFTSYGLADPRHRIYDANVNFTSHPGPWNYRLDNEFAEFIRSIRSSQYDINTPTQIEAARPVRPDSFILLSAGKDGIYGTVDDVANFNVWSEDR